MFLATGFAKHMRKLQTHQYLHIVQNKVKEKNIKSWGPKVLLSIKPWMRWDETRPVEQTRHQSWVWVRQFHCSEWNTEHTCTFVRGTFVCGEWASSYHSVLNGVSSPKAREGLRRSAVCRTRWPTYWKKTFPSPLSLFLSLHPSLLLSISSFLFNLLVFFFPCAVVLSPTRLDSFCLSALTHALFVVWPRMFAEEIFHVCLLCNLTFQTHSCSNTVIKCQPVFNQTNYCLLLAVTSCVHIFK